MKKLIYCAAALATALFAGSCQRELLDPAAEGNTVTFTVEIPEVATKAVVVEDGSNINNLVYAVYRTEASDLATAATSITSDMLVYSVNPKATGDETIFTKEGKTNVTLELINNQKYIVLFWAQVDQTWVAGKDFDLTKIAYPAKLVANKNKYAAFAGAAYVEVTGASRQSVTLTRPFAQINLATANPTNYAVDIVSSSVKVDNVYPTFNVATKKAYGELRTVEYTRSENPDGSFGDYAHYVAMNYIFANPKEDGTTQVKVTCTMDTANHGTGIVKEISNVPVAQNYKTNIVGNLLTSEVDYEVTLDDDWTGDYEVPSNGDQYTVNTNVSNADEFNAAFDSDEENVTITLTGDIDLNALLTLRNGTTIDPFYCVKSGKTLTIDLNGKKLTAKTDVADNNGDGNITANDDNQIIFDVRGNLTVKNGTIEYQHEGENMGWNASTSIFNVTAGGVLNLEGVTAKNLGGSDMSFVAHLNNWGKVTLNAENCTLESNYVPVRVFNSGPDMNNVTIKNSTLKGGSAAFWVHNYTVDDFGTASKAEAQKALLNLNIYNQGNTFSPDVNGIRYGFTNSIRTDAYGITKTVSEDGTEVTLGSFVENGVVRRGVAGAEKNSDIKKVVVGEGITSLVDRTFYRYFALETVTLPSTLTTLGTTTDDYYSCGNVFQGCSALKNIVIPESVTTMGPGTFYGCTSLESINIPAGVTSIERDALRETGLKQVEFHEGVTYFGTMALRDCKQLTEVVINAPEFTMEKNTFGIMAAPFTPMTIHVANAEMKAYVESNLTAHDKTYITVKAAEVTTTEELNIALTDGAKIVSVAAGKYTFPAGSVKAGTTIVCEEGTVFTGNSSLNINGATVIGATFENKDGEAVSGTIYGTFKNCTFEGSETLRWCYTTAGQTSLFENCVVKTTLRGVHFDEMNGDVTFKNCEINGFNAYSGAGTMTFEGCTFGHDASKYNGLNIYTNTIVKDCQFNFVSGNTNFIDMEGTGKTLTIENCTATLDGAAANVADFVGGSKLDQNTVILGGKVYASTAASLIAAVDNGATEIVLGGEFEMPSHSTNRSITFSSLNGTAVIDNTKGAYWDNATLTFNNVNFKTGTGMAGGNGSDYAAMYSTNVTYNNCNFSGPMRLGRDGAKFNACTFNNLGNDYVWTCGNKVAFDDCTFNTDGKALLIYSDGGKKIPAVSVTNCTFNATKGAKAGAIANQNCAAIEIHNYGCGVTLTTSGNTVEQGDKFSGEWRIKQYEVNENKIVVNGTEYTNIALDGKTMTIDTNKNVTVQ